MPAQAASNASASAMFSGWKKSRAVSWMAAQKGMGADRATASHGDSARSAGSRARSDRSTTHLGAPLAPWPRSGAPDLEATVVDEQLAAAGGQQRDFVCSGDVRLQSMLPILAVDDDVAAGWTLRRQDLDQRPIGQPHGRPVIGVHGGIG